MMIPDTQTRLESAAAELHKLLVGAQLLGRLTAGVARLSSDPPGAQEDAPMSIRDSDEYLKADVAVTEAQISHGLPTPIAA